MRRFMSFLLIVGILVSLPGTSMAVFGIGDIVHDPINTAQNALTAIRTATSNVNEIKLITGQTVQLLNDARNLATLPLSVIAEIQGAMSSYNQLLNQGRAMVYNAQGALATFETLFTEGKIPMTQRAVAILNEIRNTSRLGIQAQSIYDELCASAARIEQLGNASQAAIGQMQVQQAQGQLLAEQAKAQNTLLLMQANTARLQTLMQMKQVVEDEAAREHAINMMRDWPTTLGNVQGFKLP